MESEQYRTELLFASCEVDHRCPLKSAAADQSTSHLPSAQQMPRNSAPYHGAESARWNIHAGLKIAFCRCFARRVNAIAARNVVATRFEKPLSIKPISTVHGVVFRLFVLGPRKKAERQAAASPHSACRISAIAAPAAIVPSLPPTSRVALPSPIALATAASIARAASS